MHGGQVSLSFGPTNVTRTQITTFSLKKIWYGADRLNFLPLWSDIENMTDKCKRPESETRYTIELQKELQVLTKKVAPVLVKKKAPNQNTYEGLNNVLKISFQKRKILLESATVVYDSRSAACRGSFVKPRFYHAAATFMRGAGPSAT